MFKPFRSTLESPLGQSSNACKSRWFCPSCHQKNVQITARFILDHILAPVPHRHFVLAIPRMLRPYFQRHRHLLKRLCALAHESLAEYLRTALDCPKGVPGVIMTLHTFGEYLDFHPHIHALVADGLFLRDPSAAASATPMHQRPRLPLPLRGGEGRGGAGVRGPILPAPQACRLKLAPPSSLCPNRRSSHSRNSFAPR